MCLLIKIGTVSQLSDDNGNLTLLTQSSVSIRTGTLQYLISMAKACRT